MAAPIAKKLLSILPLLLVFLGSTSFIKGPGDIPVTRALELQPRIDYRKPKQLPDDLVNFVQSVVGGQENQLVGVFAGGSFALPVVQQPNDQPVYVSDEPGVVTQFGMASRRGTTGLLAHNTLAGSLFPTLQMGQQVALVYGTGNLRFFTVTEIRSYRALQPESPFSYFTDINGGTQQMTSGDLFNQIYTHGDQLIFQTCIARDGNPSWGRLFIIATPTDQLAPTASIAPVATEPSFRLYLAMIS